MILNNKGFYTAKTKVKQIITRTNNFSLVSVFYFTELIMKYNKLKLNIQYEFKITQKIVNEYT